MKPVTRNAPFKRIALLSSSTKVGFLATVAVYLEADEMRDCT